MNNTYELVKLDTNALAVISTIVAQRRGIGSATICAASRKDLPGDAMPCAAHDPQTVISTQSLVCANVCQRAGPPRDNRLSPLLRATVHPRWHSHASKSRPIGIMKVGYKRSGLPVS